MALSLPLSLTRRLPLRLRLALAVALQQDLVHSQAGCWHWQCHWALPPQALGSLRLPVPAGSECRCHWQWQTEPATGSASASECQCPSVDSDSLALWRGTLTHSVPMTQAGSAAAAAPPGHWQHWQHKLELNSARVLLLPSASPKYVCVTSCLSLRLPVCPWQGHWHWQCSRTGPTRRVRVRDSENHSVGHGISI